MEELVGLIRFSAGAFKAPLLKALEMVGGDGSWQLVVGFLRVDQSIVQTDRWVLAMEQGTEGS